MQPDRGPLGPEEIVVVAGIPRSGTSLLMQMLEAGGVPTLCDDARPPDIDNPRGYYELAAAKRLARDVSWVDAARGHAVKVVHALVPRLPSHLEYRVILAERRMDEVLASQERMLERLGDLAGGASEAVLSADRLAAVFADQLERIRRWLDAQPNVVWLHQHHADLLARPGESAARIANFLGGDLDRVAMAGAVEPELYRVRRSGSPADDFVTR